MADMPSNFVRNDPNLVKGKVEKIFSTYGFIMDASGKRQFFHFGKCITRPESLHTGDMVEFVMGYDEKSGRYHAQKVRKIEFEEYLHDSYNIPPAGNFGGGRAQTMLNLRTLHSPPRDDLRRTNGGYALGLPFGGPMLPPPPSEFEIGYWGGANQPNDVGITRQALVVQVPSDYGETATGYVAFAADGGIEMAKFVWSTLRFPQERSLVAFGVQVTVQAKYNTGYGYWEVQHLMPLAEEYYGRVVATNQQVAQIDVEGQPPKRVHYPLGFYTGKDVSEVAVGALVNFILVPSPTGEIANRLRVLVAGGGHVMPCGGAARMPFLNVPPPISSSSAVPSSISDTVSRQQSSPPTVDAMLSKSNSRLQHLVLSQQTCMGTGGVGAVSDEGDSSSLSPTSSSCGGDAGRQRHHSSPPLSPISAAMITKGFVAAVLDDVGTRLLVETQDHSRVLLAKPMPGQNFKKNDEVSFQLASVDGQPGAVSITLLPSGTLSAEFVLSESEKVGRIVKEITYGESIYEGLIECDEFNKEGGLKLRRYPFTVLSLPDVRSISRLQKGVCVRFALQTEPHIVGSRAVRVKPFSDDDDNANMIARQLFNAVHL